MKKYILIIFVFLFITSCNKRSGNMIVNGKINDFQKGKVYLEKMQDTLLVKVDSVVLDGDNRFTLYDNIESNQVYYISISESDKFLQFFGEKGTINIISNLKTFGYKPTVSGSIGQQIFEEYQKMNTKFRNLNLDLIKEKLELIKVGKTEKAIKIETKIKQLKRRKYLYTLNFATKHPNSEVTPYLILTETRNINPKLLDTIYKGMSSNVKKSLYGKKFIEFLKEKKP